MLWRRQSTLCIDWPREPSRQPPARSWSRGKLCVPAGREPLLKRTAETSSPTRYQKADRKAVPGRAPSGYAAHAGPATMAARGHSPRGGLSRRQPVRAFPVPRPWRPRRPVCLLLCSAVLASMVWVYFALPDVDRCGGAGSPAGAALPPAGAAALAAMPRHLRYPATGPGTMPPARDRYTVLLNSYRRPDLMQQSLEHYRQCSRVDAIRVIWSEDGPPPPSDDVGADGSASEDARRAARGGASLLPAPVVYDVQANASLNNRFRPPPGLRTEAVLSIDDDIFVPCDEVQVCARCCHESNLRPGFPAGWMCCLGSSGMSLPPYQQLLQVPSRTVAPSKALQARLPDKIRRT